MPRATYAHREARASCRPALRHPRRHPERRQRRARSRPSRPQAHGAHPSSGPVWASSTPMSPYPCSPYFARVGDCNENGLVVYGRGNEKWTRCLNWGRTRVECERQWCNVPQNFIVPTPFASYTVSPNVGKRRSGLALRIAPHRHGSWHHARAGTLHVTRKCPATHFKPIDRRLFYSGHQRAYDLYSSYGRQRVL